MSSYTPPTYYFNSIDFNPSFNKNCIHISHEPIGTGVFLKVLKIVVVIVCAVPAAVAIYILNILNWY